MKGFIQKMKGIIQERRRHVISYSKVSKKGSVQELFIQLRKNLAYQQEAWQPQEGTHKIKRKNLMFASMWTRFVYRSMQNVSPNKYIDGNVMEKIVNYYI